MIGRIFLTKEHGYYNVTGSCTITRYFVSWLAETIQQQTVMNELTIRS